MGRGTIVELVVSLAVLVLVFGLGNGHNILLFIIDDLRHKPDGLPDGVIKSPNMDALMDKGVRFTNMHVVKAECAPSRLALFTGRRIDALRVWDFEPRFRQANPTLVTFPEVLRNNGYETVALGKVMDPRSFTKAQRQDLCKKSNSRYCSWNRIFDVDAMQKKAPAPCRIKKAQYFPGSPKLSLYSHLTWSFPDKEVQYATDRCTANLAVSELKKLSGNYVDKGKPFLLSVGFILPHMPWVTPDSIGTMYENISDELLLSPLEGLPTLEQFRDGQSSSFTVSNNKEIERYQGNQGTPADRIRHYYRSVSFVDENVGLVLDAFDNIDKKTRDNTIIVIWSDNGFHLGEQGLWAKKTNLDTSTRVPFAIIPSTAYRAKNKDVKSGTKVKAPVHEYDIFPTLLDMVGIEDDKDQIRAGVSLVPLLKDPNSFVRSAAVTQYWAHRTSKKRQLMGYSIRTMRYRYIKYMAFEKFPPVGLQYDNSKSRGKIELYDYHLDGPVEKVNRYEDPKYAAIVQAFEALIEANEDRDWLSLNGVKPFDLK